MCVVCKEWQAGKLTSKEALRNLGELINAEEDNAHYYQVVDKVMEKELGAPQSDDDVDAAWHKERYGD